MARFHDLDAFWSERTLEPVTLRLFGEEWTLPPAWPAIVPLRIAGWLRDGRENADLSFGELMELAELMVPDDVLDEWHRRRITDDQLADVVLVLVSEYRAGPQTDQTDGGGEGEAPPPATGATASRSKRSRKGSGSSSRTSGASTGSRSKKK